MSLGLSPISLATLKTMNLTLISIIYIFYFSLPVPMGAELELNGIESDTIYLSYSRNYGFNINIVFDYFYFPTITSRDEGGGGSYTPQYFFSILYIICVSSLVDISSGVPQLCWNIISIIIEILFFAPSYTQWLWGLFLNINSIESVTTHLRDPENYRIDTNIYNFLLFWHLIPSHSHPLGCLTHTVFFLQIVSHMCTNRNSVIYVFNTNLD